MSLPNSDVVDHEVLSAFGPRLAVTCWFYGRPIHTVPRPLQQVQQDAKPQEDLRCGAKSALR